jgi:hypothetical protein
MARQLGDQISGDHKALDQLRELYADIPREQLR